MIWTGDMDRCSGGVVRWLDGRWSGGFVRWLGGRWSGNGEYSKMRLEEILPPLMGYQRIYKVPPAQNSIKYYQKDCNTLKKKNGSTPKMTRKCTKI